MGNARWPDGKAFAFTVFDDPDYQTLECGKAVYGFLADLGFRTTKAVWPLPPDPAKMVDSGITCGVPAYVDWLYEIREKGFGIGFHNATSHTSNREETRTGLDRYRELFGEYPTTMANHYLSQEGIYWGPHRLSGWRRSVYNLVTRGKRDTKIAGHLQSTPHFWGDYCQHHIRSVRNFVFPEINTLKACPMMPYHDSERPFVNEWFSSSEGSQCNRFTQCLSEENQDRLEAEGGACIMYAHFAYRFWNPDTGFDPKFRRLMERLAKKNGWFAPVHQLLDHLRGPEGPHRLTPREKHGLERRWLAAKLLHGSS